MEQGLHMFVYLENIEKYNILFYLSIPEIPESLFVKTD